MSIDFTLAPEHEAIRSRVREFIEETVMPAVAGFDRDDGSLSRSEYLKTIFGLREQARAVGLWLPHMPTEWGGMGLGHVALAMVQAEAARTRLGPWILNCQAPDEGNMHTLLHWGNDGAKGELPAAGFADGDGHVLLCHDRTRGGRIRSHPHPDPCLPRRRRVGDQRAQVVHLRRPALQLRHPHRPHRGGLPVGSHRQPTPHSSSTCPHEGWNDVREIETMHGATGHCEIVIDRPPRARPTRCSAAGARVTCWASTAWARPGWPTACAGSPRPRRRST